uniref:disease resistance protein RUN1-like n=1 Tax=Erigeron canadensis TaxID=72917 RepID=UPI001CB95600|nr:disease resistance protein RUN1-like [Erigeron canadensis]
MSRWMYDVYLSFRGLDNCKTFVDHLYNGLKRNRIHTCLDDSVAGGDVSGETEVKYDVIEKSKFLMVIFSDKYASSTSCMRELVKILDLSASSSEYKCIPVFYNVTPEMVKEQSGSYAEAFAEHEVSNKAEVGEWRKALSMAASFSGWDLNSETNGSEYKFIEDISKGIRKMFSDAPSMHAGIRVHKSESNYRHSKHSKRQLAIYWDMESCCIPNGVAPKEIYNNILACLQRETEIKWQASEVTMYAYADFMNVSPEISAGCMGAEISMVYVPNDVNDVIGKSILFDMHLYAHKNPPPSSIMLISGDASFCHTLHRLHLQDHPVIFVIPSSVGLLSALSCASIDVWDWSSVIHGEGHAVNRERGV